VSRDQSSGKGARREKLRGDEGPGVPGAAEADGQALRRVTEKGLNFEMNSLSLSPAPRLFHDHNFPKHTIFQTLVKYFSLLWFFLNVAIQSLGIGTYHASITTVDLSYLALVWAIIGLVRVNENEITIGL